MKASKNCIDVIKHYESFSANPYLCPANVATIGYGTTLYPDGRKVKLSDQAITPDEGVEYLIHDLIEHENQVTANLKVPVSQDLFDALVSFDYNEGDGKLRSSTLLKLINEKIVQTNTDWKKILSREFYKWIFGGGKKLPGLVARRSTEALLATDGIVKFFN